MAAAGRGVFMIVCIAIARMAIEHGASAHRTHDLAVNDGTNKHSQRSYITFWKDTNTTRVLLGEAF